MKKLYHSLLPVKPLASAAVLLAALIVSSQNATAQPTISSVFPNGSYQFQYAKALTFTATSSAGIANVSVTLITTNLLTGAQSFPLTLTSSGGLTISGSATDETVSAPLMSNTLYGVQIVATDVNSLSTTQTLAFDTISPAYTWEARDWNFTSNGVTGLYIDNPQTNAYAGLASTPGVDFNNPDYDLGNDGPEQYRPQGLETESCGDTARLAYSPTTTNQDFDVGYCNGGNTGNYTRHFPPGQYNVFVRAADGNGPQNAAGDLAVTAGTASFADSGPYSFSTKSSGWQSYEWYPLTNGTSPAVLTIPNDGTASTLTLTIDGGNCNVHFFMLLPVNTNTPPVGAGSVSSAFPDGTYQFQDTNTFNCTVLSTNGLESVIAEVTGSYLAGGTFQQVLTSSSGLTITGNSTDENVSFSLTTNAIYSVTILMTDGAGNNSSDNINFDTVYPNYYTWEAEDWDYNGGQYFDNPQTNAYLNLLPVYDIDSVCSGGPSGNNAYGRGLKSDTTTAMSTEPNGDVPRFPYINTGFVDYDIGYTAGGQWGNYTRHYPAGIYNIYVRLANGNGNVSTDAGTFSLVTGGYGTASQTWSQLGSFNAPVSGGWQKYMWTPVLNAAGYPARFIGSNSVPETLHMDLVNASCNLNYYMLVPANLNNNPPPFVDNFTPDGSAIFQPSNSITFTANSSVGFGSSGVVVSLNGVRQTNLTLTGNSFAYNVTCPIQTNQLYTSIITLSDSAGTTSYTNTFATFSGADYQFEAEDYDYTANGVSGQYFDNPQVDEYFGLGGTSNIDLLESDNNAFSRGYTYRAENGQDFPDTTSGDLPRTQFTSASATDYSIGSFGPNSWANYTRHYPAGTYNVIGRFAEGASLSHAGMSILTSGYGKSPQATNFLGTFTVPEAGWSTWEWAALVDNSGKLAKVTLDGTQHTLQLVGSANNSDQEVNVNFFLLAPTTPSPTVNVSVVGTAVKVSFLTQTGYTYQVEYKTNLKDPTWTPLGAPVTGNNAVQTISDTLTTNHRFYIVQIQPAP